MYLILVVPESAKLQFILKPFFERSIRVQFFRSLNFTFQKINPLLISMFCKFLMNILWRANLVQFLNSRLDCLF